MKTRRVSMQDLASQRVMKAAKKAKDPRLSALAVSMKLDAFAFVKEKVEAMISDLLAEKDEEIKKRDTCNADLHSNEQEQKMKYDEKADFQETIADQRACQQILAKALDRMKQFYDQKALL